MEPTHTFNSAISEYGAVWKKENEGLAGVMGIDGQRDMFFEICF